MTSLVYEPGDDGSAASLPRVTRRKKGPPLPTCSHARHPAGPSSGTPCVPFPKTPLKPLSQIHPESQCKYHCLNANSGRDHVLYLILNLSNRALRNPFHFQNVLLPCFVQCPHNRGSIIIIVPREAELLTQSQTAM